MRIPLIQNHLVYYDVEIYSILFSNFIPIIYCFLFSNILHILCIIVRIWNKWTCEQTLFNSARAKRPVNVMVDGNTQSKETGTDGDITVENCDFCEPYKLTAEGNK